MDTFTLTVDCGEEVGVGEYCDFNGEVEAFEDRMLGIWGYKCPKCGYQHEEDLVEPGEYDTIEEWFIDNE